MPTKLKSTDVGFVNRNRQLVMRKTSQPGNDHNQRIYVLGCLNPECRHEYGVNGSDIFQRKCPNCQGGRPGLPVRKSKTPAEVLAGIALLPPDDDGEPTPIADQDATIYEERPSRHRLGS